VQPGLYFIQLAVALNEPLLTRLSDGRITSSAAGIIGLRGTVFVGEQANVDQSYPKASSICVRCYDRKQCSRTSNSVADPCSFLT
jgi:hypothetical protein